MMTAWKYDVKLNRPEQKPFCACYEDILHSAIVGPIWLTHVYTLEYTRNANYE